MSKAWSQYQTNIFNFVQAPPPESSGNAVIKAVAGSGKSTTIQAAMAYIPRDALSIFLAFNKAIAEDLKSKGVNARTFHSLTYGPVTKSRMINNVEANKLRFICKQKLNGDDEFIYSMFISRLVGLARQQGIGCLLEDTESEWHEIINHHDLELENEKGNIPRAVELARELLLWSNESNLLDFDDLLYLAVKDGINLPKFDFVFVDEAQDTNAIQRAVLRKILKPTSRIVCVGDEAQAIYGFRGADSDSLNLLSEEFNCTELPLTVSYRCSKNVVEYARKWVKHIEAAPDAPDGEVINLSEEKLSKIITNTANGKCGGDIIFKDHETGVLVTTQSDIYGFAPDDLVVCRTSKPLIELAYRCLRAKIPVKVMGRDIGIGLKSLINKLKASSIDNLQIKLEEWAMREVDKAIAKQMDNKAEAIQDKADCILCLIDGLGEDDTNPEVEPIRTITALLQMIDELFDEKRFAVTLATIHKSKGLEALRVWWLNSSKCPAPWAKQEWQRQQERNLCYVAATRAKNVLFLIEDGSGKKKEA
jgi:DNA helicase II / ATP-dependent DNA helicase PcrA